MLMSPPSPAASKIGVIAGSGTAPLRLVEAFRRIGRPFFVICLEGQAASSLPLPDVPHAWVRLGAFGQLKDICAAEGLSQIVMVGAVRRPSLAEIKPDALGFKVLGKIGLSALGDDGLLRAVSKAIEEECGVSIVGAHEVMAELVAPEGVLTQAAPDACASTDIARGMDILAAMGPLDIGQAVVVQQGMILGVEAIEGTDALIERAGALKRAGGGGVLVKRAKPGQDLRFDMPAIGPDTIAALARAGLSGVAIEAGGSMILSRDSAVSCANESGIFIVGVKG